MPDSEEAATRRRARRDGAQGKSPSTQAGEFVKQEIDHIREGRHGARSAKQAIAIGLSKARRAGVDLPPPARGTVSEKTRRSAASAYARGQASAGRRPSKVRSQATEKALEREGHRAGSRAALSKQARSAAKIRGPTARAASARKAAQTRAARRR
jgi:hypothetical protein